MKIVQSSSSMRCRLLLGSNFSLVTPVGGATDCSTCRFSASSLERLHLSSGMRNLKRLSHGKMVAVDLNEPMNKIKESLDTIPFLKVAEDKTGVPKFYLVTVSGSIVTCLLYVFFGPGLFTDLVGLVYPAYKSFLAIETEDKEDDKQWLTYWVVYAVFDLLETFIKMLLFWFPFYHAFKVGFLMWCFLPSSQGSLFVYKHALQPTFQRLVVALDTPAPQEEAKKKD